MDPVRCPTISLGQRHSWAKSHAGGKTSVTRGGHLDMWLQPPWSVQGQPRRGPKRHACSGALSPQPCASCRTETDCTREKGPFLVWATRHTTSERLQHPSMRSRPVRTRQVRAGAEHPAPAHASRLLPGPTLPPLSWEDGCAGAGGACVHAAASPRLRASHHPRMHSLNPCFQSAELRMV